MLNKDEVEKQRRGYTDPKSFVRLDGSERLMNKDWRKRKGELWTRSGGYCEWILVPYLERVASTGSEFAALMPCKSLPDDPHHIKPRSKGRDDRLQNLLALCRYHHDLLDKRKPKWTPKEVEA